MAQDSLCRTDKVGLIFSFDGSHFGYFGVKYWFTNKLAAQGTFNFQHYHNDNQEDNPTQDETDNSYTPGIGLQYIFLTTENIDLIGLCNGSISFINNRITNNFLSSSPSTITLSTYSVTTYNLTFGIGAEYWLSKRWSLTGIQSFTISQSSTNISDPRASGKKTINQTIKADNAKLVVTFYF